MLEKMMQTFNCDDWQVEPTSCEDFGDVLSAITRDSVWEAGITSSSLRTRALMGPLEKASLMEQLRISELTAQDTCERSRLVLQYRGREDCLRDCAFTGLLDAARVHGNCFRDMPAEAASSIINTALMYARGSSLLLHRGEKITAIMSSAYCIMDQDKLLEIMLDEIRGIGLGRPAYIKGNICHEKTWANFELPDAQKSLNRQFKDALNPDARQFEVMPAVKFSTSDVRNNAATLEAQYRIIGHNEGYLTFSQPLKVEHRRAGEDSKNGLDAFKFATTLLYAQFQESKKNIERMSNHWMHYPLNAYIHIIKKIGIPKKYAKDGYEDLERYTGGKSCSMYDVYLSMALSVEAAKKAGVHGVTLNTIEDALASVLKLEWSEFDLPGNVMWSLAA